MPIPFPLIVAAAETIATAYAEQQRNAETMANFARMLAGNNSALLREMSAIVAQALSDVKLNDCNNKLATLATFYGEYANNLNDIAKLSLIEQQSQFVLDTLDDPDISLSGVRTYITVASLRINALALKSLFQPGDRDNAKALANSAIQYANGIRPNLISATEARVGPVLIAENSMGNNRCSGFSYFTVDGTAVIQGNYIRPTDAPKESGRNCRDYVSAALKTSAEQGRLNKIAALVSDLPLEDIDKCIIAWQQFVQI